MSTRRLIFLLPLALWLTACVGAPPPAPEGYPTLTVAADESSTLLFTKPDMNLGAYSKIVIKPVIADFTAVESSMEVAAEDVDVLTSKAQEFLHEQLGKHFEIVDQPAADTLSVSLKIIHLQPTSAAQTVMFVPPFSLINMFSPKGLFTGVIAIAGELHEGLDPEPSVAFVAIRSRPGADVAAGIGRWSFAERVLEQSAKRLAEDLEKLRE